MDPQIFITYSSKDQKVARTICTALENRGLACWISSRNVKPGQNFQEQIVKAIRGARIMVLVFTANANNSNEIKKELALASQNNLLVIPVRIEDVVPNEAFAYEFATRQWIDLFEDWENSIAHLVELIAAAIDDHPSGNRAKEGLELTGGASALSLGKTVTARSATATAPASFLRQPKLRWTMIGGLVVIVAAAIAYGAVTLSQQRSSSPATITVGSQMQSQTRTAATPAAITPVEKPPSRSCFARQTLAKRADFVAWSNDLSLDAVRADIDGKIAQLFACQTFDDAQAFGLFARISMLIAQAVSDPSCFDGDAGVIKFDGAFHLSFAQSHGRAVANSNLQWKAGKALGCVDKVRQGQLFADMAMALVDADRSNN